MRFLVLSVVLLGYALTLPVRLLVAAPHGEQARKEAMQRCTRQLLVRLGASFVKGAQLLSTRRDVLPAHWCDALAQLNDRVPAMRPESARRLLRAAYPDGEIRPADLDWDSVSSGSIACVYRAELADGRRVAVKIRRPGVAARIRDDFAILRVGAALVQWLPGLRRVPAATMVAQLGEAIAAQSDFARELTALRMLRVNLADLDYLRIPRPVPNLCRPDVLVMEYIADLRPVGPGTQACEVARRILNCVYRMLFLDGLVHCDMHPGNLYLQPGGRIVLLDAGFVVRLDVRVRRLFAEFFLALANGDGLRCAELVRLSAARVPATADLDAFRADMTELVAQSSRRRAAEFSLVRFATRLFDLQRRHGLFAAPEFVFPLLALLVLEGRINELDAEVDFQRAALPVLLTALPPGRFAG